MVKSILKRIIVGVGIALIIALFKGSLIADVSAMQVDSFNMGAKVGVVTNMTGAFTYALPSPPWSSLSGTYGYIHWSFSIYKVDGSSTSINIMPRFAYVETGGKNYICDIGSPTITNSTFNGGSYSATCPVQMGSNGIVTVGILLQDIQSNVPSESRVTINNMISYEISDNANVSVNVDTSGITSGIASTNDKLDDTNDKLDETNDKLDETNDNLSDINDTLNDDTIDDDSVDDTLDDLQGQITSNGVITDLLLLPVTLYQSILNSLNDSECLPWNLGSLYGHDLILPCINLEYLLGMGIYNTIDLILAGLMILAIRKKLVDIFNHMTSLNDRGNEVE